MLEFDYTLPYKEINFRNQPCLYRIGRGEQGVLLVEPYKSEICPHWKFRTPEIARLSAEKIYRMFLDYLKDGDFVGADMARKFLMMGWTRARRYANHKSGRKYDSSGIQIAQDEESEISPKAQSAAIFKSYYDLARSNPVYISMYSAWRELEKEHS